MLFAVTDTTTNIPSTVFGLMALIITTLVGVIAFQQRQIYKLLKDKDDLQEKRYTDSITNRDRYDLVMGKFSQSFDLFVAKLEATKSGKG